jgi:hypothetical protein
MRQRQPVELRTYRRRPPFLRPRQWGAKVVLPVLLLAILAMVQIWWGSGKTSEAQVYGCTVTDGDTIRCGDERIRLLGIDAPEMPGHCRPGRRCVTGDPFASRDSLANAVGYSMNVSRVGADAYGRTLATVLGPRGDLSCWQLSKHQAQYRMDWDDGYRVARMCPDALW